MNVIFKRKLTMPRVKYVMALLLLIVSPFLHAQQPSADAVLKEAVANAAKSHKQVFLSFHASWCGWCHRMDSLMTKTELKPIFDKHFVIAHITVMEHAPEKKKNENTGGLELMKTYGGYNTGIPYWLVFNSDGTFLANSRLKAAGENYTSDNGDNVGCPGTEEELVYWVRLLVEVAHFTPKEAEAVKAVFAKKKA